MFRLLAVNSVFGLRTWLVVPFDSEFLFELVTFVSNCFVQMGVPSLPRFYESVQDPENVNLFAGNAFKRLPISFLDWLLS